MDYVQPSVLQLTMAGLPHYSSTIQDNKTTGWFQNEDLCIYTETVELMNGSSSQNETSQE